MHIKRGLLEFRALLLFLLRRLLVIMEACVTSIQLIRIKASAPVLPVCEFSRKVPNELFLREDFGSNWDL